MKKAVLRILVLSEIILSVWLGISIAGLLKTKRTPIVIPLDTRAILGTQSGTLKFFFEPSPLTTVSSELPVPWITYEYKTHINADSLNEIRDYAVEKPAGVQRIITLGDSFTYGLFVNTEDNWTERLERQLNADCGHAFEVINLGVSGYDTQYSAERFRKRGEKYHPDMVIWLFQNNDFEELSEFMMEKEKFYIADMKKTGEWDKLVKQGIPYPPGVKMTEDMNKITKTMGKTALLEMQKGFIRQLIGIFPKTLVLATFADTKDEYRTILKNFSGEYKTIRYVEIPDLKKIDGATFMPNDYHPSVLGHQIIGDAFFRAITENALVSCDNRNQ